MDSLIYGLCVDDMGRCEHYHNDFDIAALKCSYCQKYFACYKCHNQLMAHKFYPCSKDDKSILCGNCRETLDFKQYESGECRYCHHKFNSRCAVHYKIYFK